MALLSRLRRRPRGVAFVSYSYRDEAALRELRSVKPRKLELNPFPPITVPPSEMVSTELLAAIADCDCLIVIGTENSSRSPWVSIETDYARRIGKQIFVFRSEERTFRRDTGKALDLPIFPSFARPDSAAVMQVLDHMRNDRYFDVFVDTEEISPGDNFAEQIVGGLNNRLKRGGYAVIFLTRSAVESEYVMQEVGKAMDDSPVQVLPVLLDDVVLPPRLADIQALRVRRLSDSRFNQNDIDDLIVRLYWLIQARLDKPAA